MLILLYEVVELLTLLWRRVFSDFAKKVAAAVEDSKQTRDLQARQLQHLKDMFTPSGFDTEVIELLWMENNMDYDKTLEQLMKVQGASFFAPPTLVALIFLFSWWKKSTFLLVENLYRNLVYIQRTSCLRPMKLNRSPSHSLRLLRFLPPHLSPRLFLHLNPFPFLSLPFQ